MRHTPPFETFCAKTPFYQLPLDLQLEIVKNTKIKKDKLPFQYPNIFSLQIKSNFFIRAIYHSKFMQKSNNLQIYSKNSKNHTNGTKNNLYNKLPPAIRFNLGVRNSPVHRHFGTPFQTPGSDVNFWPLFLKKQLPSCPTAWPLPFLFAFFRDPGWGPKLSSRNRKLLCVVVEESWIAEATELGKISCDFGLVFCWNNYIQVNGVGIGFNVLTLPYLEHVW